MLTPRQFASQLHVHQDIMNRMNGNAPAGMSTSAPAGYIDQIPGW